MPSSMSESKSIDCAYSRSQAYDLLGESGKINVAAWRMHILGILALDTSQHDIKQNLKSNNRENYNSLNNGNSLAKLPHLSQEVRRGHFAKDCRSKQGNIARSTIYQELDLDDNWDIVSADFDDSSVYSISKREGDVHQNISIMVQDTPLEEAAFMAIEGINESDDEQRKQPHNPEDEKDFHNNEVRLLKELLKEKIEQVQQMIKDQAKVYYENKPIIQRKEEL
ncbi:hypothetical protein Tco_0733114 [Tanacetum coccineum]